MWWNVKNILNRGIVCIPCIFARSLPQFPVLVAASLRVTPPLISGKAWNHWQGCVSHQYCARAYLSSSVSTNTNKTLKTLLHTVSADRWLLNPQMLPPHAALINCVHFTFTLSLSVRPECRGSWEFGSQSQSSIADLCAVCFALIFTFACVLQWFV